MTGVSEALKIELRSVLLANQEAVRTGITAQQLLRKSVYLTFSLIWVTPSHWVVSSVTLSILNVFTRLKHLFLTWCVTTLSNSQKNCSACDQCYLSYKLESELWGVVCVCYVGDYSDLAEQNLPYRACGFRDVLSFCQSIPDVIQVVQTS